MNTEQPTACSECGAYKGHGPVCSLMTKEEAIEQLKLYYKAWAESGTKYCSMRDRLCREIVFWQGKFSMVKRENNQLRNKLYRKTKTPQSSNEAGSSLAPK